MISFSQGLIENKRQRTLCSVLALFLYTLGIPVLAPIANGFYVYLIALVVLRKGLHDALMLFVLALAWGLGLLALADFALKSVVALMVTMTWLKLGVTALAAHSYRLSKIWCQPSFVMVGVLMVSLMGLHIVLPELNANIQESVLSMLPPETSALFAGPDNFLYGYLFATLLVNEMTLIMLVLVFARYMQSQCYFPEGFAVEWKGARCPIAYYKALFAVMGIFLLFYFFTDDQGTLQVLLEFMVIAYMPAVLETVFLGHQHWLKQGGQLAVVAYYVIILLLFSAFYPVFAMISCARCFFNLRNT